MLSFATESYECHDFKPLLRYETTILTNISKTVNDEIKDV